MLTFKGVPTVSYAEHGEIVEMVGAASSTGTTSSIHMELVGSAISTGTKSSIHNTYGVGWNREGERVHH